jgi:hypothetical protein
MTFARSQERWKKLLCCPYPVAFGALASRRIARTRMSVGWQRGTACTRGQLGHPTFVVVVSVVSAACAVVDAAVIRPARVRIIALVLSGWTSAKLPSNNWYRNQTPR